MWVWEIKLSQNSYTNKKLSIFTSSMTLTTSICNVALTVNLVVLLKLDFNVSWQVHKHILNHLKINNANIMCIKDQVLLQIWLN